MEGLLDRIKARIDEPTSPVKSIKSLAEGIDMSQQGFYKMTKSGRIKKGTLLAICDTLNVELNFFEGVVPESLTSISQNESALMEQDGVIGEELRYISNNNDLYFRTTWRQFNEIKLLLEAQLQAKDRQLDAKNRQIEKLLDLLGKPEGAIFQPLLSAGKDDFQQVMGAYVSAVVHNRVIPMLEEMAE